MSHITHVPQIITHPPVSIRQIVEEGYLTLDACALMHPNAAAFVSGLIAELHRQKRRVWESADVLAELQRNAGSDEENTRLSAHRALRLYQLMLDADVLDTYSDTPDVDQICDHSSRPVFADNVIVARIRMFSSTLPCTVVTFDRSLTAMLLSKPAFDCDTRSGYPVRVYRFDAEGQPCPVTLDAPSRKPVIRARTVLPLSQLVPLTAIENAPIPRAPMGDSVTGVRTGASFPLGRMIGVGGESEVYAVEGDDTLAVKIFLTSTIHKVAKVSLLAEQQLNLPDVAMPIEEVVNPADGNVVGYVMPRLRGVSVEALLTARGQQRHAPFWCRKEYVRMAIGLVRQADALLQKGILLADISAKNFLVAKEADGSLNPDRVMVIDVDSAQLGNARTGMLPAEGATPEYLAPCLLRSGITDQTIRDKNSLSFSVALLALQLVLGGVHPFRVCGEDGNDAKSLAERIEDHRFPFGAGEKRREAKAAPGAEYLWSHTTKAFKVYFSSIFRSDGERSAPENRPSLQEIGAELRKLLYWMENLADDEDLSLNPTGYRAFTLTCKHCGKDFDGNHHSADARKYGVCDDCLQQSAGVCRDCGNPLDMTRGEMLRRGITREPSRCKACHIRAQTPAPQSAAASVLLYTKCPVCGNAHKAAQACPVCAAAAADKALVPEKAPSLITRLKRIRWMP